MLTLLRHRVSGVLMMLPYAGSDTCVAVYRVYVSAVYVADIHFLRTQKYVRAFRTCVSYGICFAESRNDMYF